MLVNFPSVTYNYLIAYCYYKEYNIFIQVQHILLFFVIFAFYFKLPHPAGMTELFMKKSRLFSKAVPYREQGADCLFPPSALSPEFKEMMHGSVSLTDVICRSGLNRVGNVVLCFAHSRLNIVSLCEKCSNCR